MTGNCLLHCWQTCRDAASDLRFCDGVQLFGIMAIEVKRKAPTAHTVLEIIRECYPSQTCSACAAWYDAACCSGHLAPPGQVQAW